jgi:hypothetical protein
VSWRASKAENAMRCEHGYDRHERRASEISVRSRTQRVKIRENYVNIPKPSKLPEMLAKLSPNDLSCNENVRVYEQ